MSLFIILTQLIIRSLAKDQTLKYCGALDRTALRNRAIVALSDGVSFGAVAMEYLFHMADDLRIVVTKHQPFHTKQESQVYHHLSRQSPEQPPDIASFDFITTIEGVELLMLMSMVNKEAWYQQIYIPGKPHAVGHSWLGTGATGNVFCCRDADSYFVVKFYRENMQPALDNEIAILKDINEKFIQILPHGMSELSKVLPTINQLAPLVAEISPLCQGLQRWNRQYVRDVISALFYGHSAGYVHRDVRTANIMIASDSAILLDWGFAVKIKKDNGIYVGEYSGTGSCASLEILRQRAQGKDEIAVRTNDDLCSLVLTVGLTRVAEVDDLKTQPFS